MDAFFEGIDLPSIKMMDGVEMEAPITQTKIETAIMKLASGKTPGDYSLGTEFYKCFKKQLSPFLLKLFDGILASESIPLSLN